MEPQLEPEDPLHVSPGRDVPALDLIGGPVLLSRTLGRFRVSRGQMAIGLGSPLNATLQVSGLERQNKSQSTTTL